MFFNTIQKTHNEMFMKFIFKIFFYHNDYVPVHKYCSNSISGNCQYCNGQRAHLKGERLWIQASVGSNQKYIKLVLVVSRLCIQY